jgi:hypothetical protein
LANCCFFSRGPPETKNANCCGVQELPWYYDLFLHGRDFVQLAPGWNDLRDTLVELEASPSDAAAIAASSFQRATQLLSEHAVDCYWWHLFHLASEHLALPEQLDPGAMPLEVALLQGDAVQMGKRGASSSDVACGVDVETVIVIPVRASETHLMDFARHSWLANFSDTHCSGIDCMRHFFVISRFLPRPGCWKIVFRVLEKTNFLT